MKLENLKEAVRIQRAYDKNQKNIEIHKSIYRSMPTNLKITLSVDNPVYPDDREVEIQIKFDNTIMDYIETVLANRCSELEDKIKNL